MLFGLNQGNERQIKLKKSQIYREMLDNQLLLNQKYNQIVASRVEQIKKNDSNLFPITQQKKQQHLKYSIVNGNLNKNYQQPVKLPVLKDHNYFIRGASKFINPNDKQFKKSKIKRTEEIPQNQSEEQGYNSTCEQIIKELQMINKESSRYKLRKRRQKTQHRPYMSNNIQKYNQQSYLNQKISEKNNYKTNLNYELSSMSKKTYQKSNQIFEQDSNYQNQFASSFSNRKQPQKTIIYPQKQIYLQQKSNDSTNTKKISSQSKYPSPSPLQKRQKIKTQNSHNIQHIQQKQNSKHSLLSQQQIKRTKQQRQTFLQILRKVKNRGESLYFKLSKYPFQK